MKIKKFLLPIWWYNRGSFPLRNKYLGIFVLNGFKGLQTLKFFENVHPWQTDHYSFCLSFPVSIFHIDLLDTIPEDWHRFLHDGWWFFFFLLADFVFVFNFKFQSFSKMLQFLHQSNVMYRQVQCNNQMWSPWRRNFVANLCLSKCFLCCYSRCSWLKKMQQMTSLIQQGPGIPIRITNIDLMHWCHISITTTPCWGSRLVALRARAVLEERWLSVSARARASPAVYGMQELARWLHAWRWRTRQCLVWPQTRGGALLWRHMHKVYCVV